MVITVSKKWQQVYYMNEVIDLREDGEIHGDLQTLGNLPLVTDWLWLPGSHVQALCHLQSRGTS